MGALLSAKRSGPVTYAYRGDLETRLSFSKEIKTGHLKMCGFDKEIVAFEDVDAGDLQWRNVVRNEGIMRNHSLMRRFHTSCNSKVICMIGPIHSTIFEQPKVLPPFTHLEVTFERTRRISSSFQNWRICHIGFKCNGWCFTFGKLN